MPRHSMPSYLNVMYSNVWCTLSLLYLPLTLCPFHAWAYLFTCIYAWNYVNMVTQSKPEAMHIHIQFGSLRPSRHWKSWQSTVWADCRRFNIKQNCPFSTNNTHTNTYRKYILSIPKSLANSIDIIWCLDRIYSIMRIRYTSPVYERYT